MQIFDNYSSEASFDEVFDDKDTIRECWKEIVEDIENSGLGLLKAKQSEIDWHLEENGVTYNIYDDYDKPANRSWSLDPIPFVIEEKEWEGIRAGLEQRARLFNLILKDLYGDQNLIKENIIPAEVIYGHKGFSSEVFDFGYKEDFQLYFYATDIARGPDGKMWVIADKTQAPSGLGYTIENRMTMNVVANALYPNISKKKLTSFMDDYKEMLRQLSGGDLSSAVLLTPGPHNETYFEHAYLSSYLGMNMVQGQDLLTKNGTLWLKSLSGLKKINTLLRRVDDRFCDPLELRSDSGLGVAGLVETMREDNLKMVNPIGSAITENIGLNPFMEKIAEYFLEEELILPQIATWWCGQKIQLEYVLEHLDGLIIKKIDRTEQIEIYLGKNLTPLERETLVALMEKHPYKYVAQEEITFSTVPYYNGVAIEPRNAVIRTYCVKKGSGYSVMNGGLVRVSASHDNLIIASNGAGVSKDLWILGEDKSPLYPLNKERLLPFVETSINAITTLKAENLFWLGRYLARAISTTRLISHVVKKITNFYRYEVTISKESQYILQNSLTHMTMTYPGFMERESEKNLDIFPMIEITSIVKDGHRVGSLSSTLGMLDNANRNLKDILTLKSWKLFETIQKEWYLFSHKKGDTTLVVSSELEKLLIYLMAYKELVQESVFKEQGLILYEIGYKIEDALLLISKTKSMLCLKLDKSVGYDVLEGMLNSMESFNAYRSHYKSSLTLKNVVDFILFNRQFPKSLTYTIESLLSEFAHLPKANKENKTAYTQKMLDAKALLRSIHLEELLTLNDDEVVYKNLDTLLSQLSDLFLECSNTFSNTYFSHYDE